MSRDVATREDAKKALADHDGDPRLAGLVGDLQLQTYVMLNIGAYHMMIGDVDVAHRSSAEASRSRDASGGAVSD